MHHSAALVGNEHLETAVVLRSNDSPESYFVPAEYVDGDRVRVTLRETSSFWLATLPTNEPVTIPVNKSEVQQA